MKMSMDRGEIIIYQTPDGATNLDVRLADETIWLTQAQIAELFGTKRPAITKHLTNIFYDAELEECSVCSILEHTAKDRKTYQTKFYNLDAILSVGYRVNSKNATKFRIWANKILKEYIVRGYVINQRAKVDQLEDLKQTVIMNFTLRPFRDSDLSSLVKYANNYNIAKFLTNQFPHPYTDEDGRKFISSVANNDPINVFAIEINGEAAGAIGIFPQSDIHEKNAETGYWLAEPFWGNGITTRAIVETVVYGFRTFDVTRIYARPFSNNPASHRVLEKAGFTCEARLKNAIYKNGVYFDELIYAIRRNGNG